MIIMSGHVENCNDRQWASGRTRPIKLRFEDMLLPHSPRLLRAPAMQTKEETGE